MGRSLKAILFGLAGVYFGVLAYWRFLDPNPVFGTALIAACLNMFVLVVYEFRQRPP